MRTSRILALAAAALLVVAPAARAQQPSQKFLPSTISLSGGGYMPEGTDLDESDADTGLAVFLNTGYMMSPSRGLQFDLGYFETSGENGLQVSSIPIALSFKLALPISFIEPYVLGGARVYFRIEDGRGGKGFYSAGCPKTHLPPTLLKKVHMQGGGRCEARGVLSTYVAAPHPSEWVPGATTPQVDLFQQPVSGWGTSW